MNSLRLYTFVNFYLSSIQQGIQSAHVISELFTKYKGSRAKCVKLLDAWNIEGKTMIVLNGGPAGMIASQHDELVEASGERGNYLQQYAKAAKYPFAAFYEEPGAIHETQHAITAWGIVLPEEVYNARTVEVFPSLNGYCARPADLVKADDFDFWLPGSFEHLICSLLQGKSLAR